MGELFIRDNLHEADNLWKQIEWFRKRIEQLEAKVRALEAQALHPNDGLAYLRVE